MHACRQFFSSCLPAAVRQAVLPVCAALSTAGVRAKRARRCCGRQDNRPASTYRLWFVRINPEAVTCLSRIQATAAALTVHSSLFKQQHCAREASTGCIYTTSIAVPACLLAGRQYSCAVFYPGSLCSLREHSAAAVVLRCCMNGVLLCLASV